MKDPYLHQKILYKLFISPRLQQIFVNGHITPQIIAILFTSIFSLGKSSLY